MPRQNPSDPFETKDKSLLIGKQATATVVKKHRGNKTPKFTKQHFWTKQVTFSTKRPKLLDQIFKCKQTASLVRNDRTKMSIGADYFKDDGKAIICFHIFR